MWSSYFDAPGGVGPGVVALVLSDPGAGSKRSPVLLGSFISEEGAPDWYEVWDGSDLTSGAIAVTNGTLAHIGVMDSAGAAVIVSVDLRQGAEVGRVALAVGSRVLSMYACEAWGAQIS